MKCNHCNTDLLPTIKDKGPHVGVYCSFCGKWIKWLDKKEKVKYTHLDGTPYATLAGKTTTDNDDDGEVPW